MNSESTLNCIACNRTSTEIPLITLTYREGTFCICPQHLPVLIHDPQMLIGRLPGAETMQPADHHD
ncbi:MAG: hypothetical protein HY960_00325 [Ignavibacteriae bacterium]|nr:hypothetical protein [Ignavibacteriota bacterium]